MQLMCDAVSVLGSRHGLLIDPLRKSCGIIRYDAFTDLPEIRIRAGAVIDGKEYILPLAPDGEAFAFHDQRLTPCTLSVMGIHPQSALKLKLTLVTPFRPRDGEFSTTPVLGLRIEASTLQGQFRWEARDIELPEVEIFLEVDGPALDVAGADPDSVDLRFAGKRFGPDYVPLSDAPQHDRLIVIAGARRGRRFTRTVHFDRPEAEPLDIMWCTWDSSGLVIKGESCPPVYTRRFSDLDAVADWARGQGPALFENAAKVDGIVARNNCGTAVNNLLAQTLHSWLINTWWVDRGDRDWFSVWEGSCYLHSTVDVEFTQSPFYLAVWPELLRIELETWPEYAKSGECTLGERGRGTLFLSHDMGQGSVADAQAYSHEMEVEENCNYILMAYAYWKRTGDETVIHTLADRIEKYLGFIAACDTTGNGVPDRGVSNTIDDASPAIQYGREQIYLAVKAMASFETGGDMMQLTGQDAAAERCRAFAAKIRGVIEEKGWAGDHFVTLLDKRAEGVVDPWTGELLDTDEVPGWDAAHIYAANGLAPLDMIGRDVGLDAEKLKHDLVTATERCLKEYGCVHTDFFNTVLRDSEAMAGLAGASRNPGWVSMNMLRDIAAFYRGIDLRRLAQRYWAWQVTANTQEPKVFFETFNGNNLCFYPRGVAVWGFFDALAGLVINSADGIDRANPPFPQVTVPRLLDADWKSGTCRVISSG
ncbi:glutaminase domain-containing protein [Verrucomicrobiota bacterium]